MLVPGGGPAAFHDADALTATAASQRSAVTRTGEHRSPAEPIAELLGHLGTAMLDKHYSHLTAGAKALRDALGRVR